MFIISPFDFVSDCSFEGTGSSWKFNLEWLTAQRKALCESFEVLKNEIEKADALAMQRLRRYSNLSANRTSASMRKKSTHVVYFTFDLIRITWFGVDLFSDQAAFRRVMPWPWLPHVRDSSKSGYGNMIFFIFNFFFIYPLFTIS